MGKLYALPLLLIVGLAGGGEDCCAEGLAGEQPLPPVITSSFLCDDGRDLNVAFHTLQPTRVVIVTGRRTIDLPQTTSGSGARYSDGVTTFWNKGEQATFEWGNGATQCRARH